MLSLLKHVKNIYEVTTLFFSSWLNMIRKECRKLLIVSVSWSSTLI